MPATARWVLDPACPRAGDRGPPAIRGVEEAPIRRSVRVIRESLGQQTPDETVVQLLDEDGIAAASLIAAAPKMRDALQALVQWARHTGGWDAFCWREAERVLAAAAGTQVPAEAP